MPRKNTKNTKRRTNNPQKRVAQDLRRFKQQLKRWIDTTHITWEGKPYTQGSTYRFVLDDKLISFVIRATQAALETDEAKAQLATLEMAEKVRLANLPDPEDDETLELEPETDAAFEKFLTVSESNGIIDSDAKETETTEAEEALSGSPEGPPGDGEGA